MSYQWQEILAPCDTECGEGEREFTYECYNGVGLVVDDIYCEDTVKGYKSPLTCVSNKGCKGYWDVEIIEVCDNACGKGELTKEYQCFDRETKQTVLDDEECGPKELEPSPRTYKEDCIDETACSGRWKETSECRSSCGEGVRIFGQMCVDKRQTDVEVDEEECPPKPLSKAPEKCTVQCPTGGGARWVIEDESEGKCAEDVCGPSWRIQTRVCCESVDGDTGNCAIIVADDECFNNGLNYKDLEILDGTCESNKNCEYIAADGTCSANCGKGTLEDLTTCVNKNGNWAVDDRYCTEAGLSKDPPRECIGRKCEGDNLCQEGDGCELVEVGQECPAACNITNLVPLYECQKDNVYIDEYKCKDLDRPAETIGAPCYSSATCTYEYDYCCSDDDLVINGCNRGDGVSVSSDDCMGIAVEPVCGSESPKCSGSEFNTVVPIVAGSLSVLVLCGFVGGVYFYVWNRRRLNKKAQDSMATPFSLPMD